MTFGTVASPSGIPGRTVREVVISGEFGSELQKETFLFTNGGYAPVGWTVNTRDENDRLLGSAKSDGSITESTWSCCGKASEIDAAGITRAYSYNSLCRLASETRQTPAGLLATDYTRDALGRVLTRAESAGGLSRYSETVYDLTGRVVRSRNAGGLVTA